MKEIEIKNAFFEEVYEATDKGFRFLVTEIYKSVKADGDCLIVCYYHYIPAAQVEFRAQQLPSGYTIDVGEAAVEKFYSLLDAKHPDEVIIYPSFE